MEPKVIVADNLVNVDALPFPATTEQREDMQG